jgi:hypothetical protein
MNRFDVVVADFVVATGPYADEPGFELPGEGTSRAGWIATEGPEGVRTE